MKKIIFFLSALAFISFVSAQDLLPFVTKDAAGKNKWGYKDASGKIVIEPKYAGYASFNDGFAAVEFNGKMGYIDKTGKEVTGFKYDKAKDFYKGFGKVSKPEFPHKEVMEFHVQLISNIWIRLLLKG